MKIIYLFVTAIALCYGFVPSPVSFASPCDEPTATLRINVRIKIGQQQKDSAIILARCLVAREPTLDSNFMLLAMAWLCDSIPERNTHTDTIMALGSFRNALTLNRTYHVMNALGNLHYGLGPFPYDSALFYYTGSAALLPRQEIAYRQLSRIYEAAGDTFYKKNHEQTIRMDSILAKEENKRRENNFREAKSIHRQYLIERETFRKQIDSLSKYYDQALVEMDKCIFNCNTLQHNDIIYRKSKVALVLKQNEYKPVQDFSKAMPDLYFLTNQEDSGLKANAYYFLGTIHERKNQPDSALTNYRKATNWDNQRILYWQSLLKLIAIDCRKNRNCHIEEEEHCLSQLVDLDTLKIAYYFRLGYIYDSLGFNAQKVALYKKGAGRFGKSENYFSEWLQNYSMLQPEIDSLEYALNNFQVTSLSLQQLPPEYFQALHILGFDYYKVDNFIRAGYIIEKLVTFFPKDDSLKIILSGIYLRKNQMKNSLRMARKAKRQGKDFMDYKVMAYGLAAKNHNTRSRGKYKKAIKQVDKLIEQTKANNSATTHTELDVEELEKQRSMMNKEIAENLYQRKHYRKGRKYNNRSHENHR